MILINIRFLHYHLFLTKLSGFTISQNQGHALCGEFRKKPGWKRFQIYKFIK